VAQLVRVPLGYQTEGVLLARLGLRQRAYPDAAARLAFYERLLPRLAQVPGVEWAALSDWPALQPQVTQPVETQDAGGSGAAQSGVVGVSPGYFAALGVPLVEGRAFTASDRSGAGPVAVVSQTLARRLWPQAGALGQRIRVRRRSDAPGAATPPWRTVVGVARDVRQSPTDDDPADLYVPLLEAPGRFATLYARTGGTPAASFPALRRALKEIDPEVSLDSPRSLEGLIDDQLARPKFLAGLLAGFGLLAALLGVYGVITYEVKQREHEIAVRMAVGASAPEVTRMFVRQGALVLAIGICAGLGGATALARMLRSQLFGVGPADGWTLGAAALVLAAAGLAAVWWPAHKAARTDPAVALRVE